MGTPGFRLEVHEALSSTSDLVAERAAAGEPGGLAVLARRQTAGRGTKGRHWESPAGNLYMTVLLRPGGALREAPQWGLLAGVALAETVAALLPDPKQVALKWPNDLLLRGRKLAGILAEASATPGGTAIGWVSIGIGVNLAAAPEVPGRETACLAGEGIVAPTPMTFAVQLLERLDQWCDRRRARGFGAVRDAWLHWGPAPDAPIRVSAPGGATTAGRFAGLAEDGSLLIAGEGQVQRLAAGEVTH